MIRKGRGISTIYYPSGFNGGGDPDLVSLRMKPDGTIDISNASCEMGQGLKNVAVQIAAECLGIAPDKMNFDNSNSDTAAFSMDTAGTRSTVVVGNAIIAAANDLIGKFKAFVAEKMGVTPEEMSYEAGRAFVTAEPEKGMTIPEIAGASIYGGVLLMGTGGYLPEPAPPRDPETGATLPSKILAYGSCVADVEVDDETGMVRVVNLYNCYDMGTVINPVQAIAQVEGGNIMGMGMALFEDLAPGFPKNLDMYAGSYTDYIIPTCMDIPDRMETTFYENYDPNGPFGAKGCGEMVVDTQSPAIINAIYDAVGVLVESLPASPEKILRLIKAKQ
jgi:CO/xanthine dehydrogenase Mo-binding subunit